MTVSVLNWFLAYLQMQIMHKVAQRKKLRRLFIKQLVDEIFAL